MIRRLVSHLSRHPLAGRPGVRQFVKFSIIGVWNTLSDFGVYLLLTRVVHLHYVLANLCSFLTAATMSFFLNKFWTFRDRERNNMARQYVKFISVSSIGAAIASGVLFVAVHFLHLNDLFGKCAAVALVLIWNFFANKYWTFRPTRPPGTLVSQG